MQVGQIQVCFVCKVTSNFFFHIWTMSVYDVPVRVTVLCVKISWGSVILVQVKI